MIENSCSKPSGFVNFQLGLNLSPIMGDLVSFIDLASGQQWQTGGNIGREWDDKTVGWFTFAYKHLIYKCQYIRVHILEYNISEFTS